MKLSQISAILGVVAILAASAYALLQATPEPIISTPANTFNGLNTQALNELALHLKKSPESGKVTFFSNTNWQEGMCCITSITGYKIDERMLHENDRKFNLVSDELADLNGSDTAPGAVEEMMYAIGTCIAASANANAALMGIKLTKLEVSLESDLDLHGMMNINSIIRPGILSFRTKIKIAGNATDDVLKKIALAGYRLSPVYDTILHGVSKVESPVIEIAKS
jgi:uncharacterized OsmC-like protein